jgi:hypothetical protein
MGEAIKNAIHYTVVLTKAHSAAVNKLTLNSLFEQWYKS